MDLLQDYSHSHTMRGLDVRLKGFLEQVNRLQEANQRLEAQIVNWGVRGTSHSQDWSKQEQTVSQLRAQVRLLRLSRSFESLKSVVKTVHSCLPG